MDTYSNISYSVRHETPWNESTVRNTKASRHRDVESREAVPDGGRHLERQLKLGRTVESNSPEARAAWTSTETQYRTPVPHLRIAERKIEANPAERIASCRILQRLVDFEPNWGRDSQAIRCSLSDHARLACNVCRASVELAETREAGNAAGRRSHRALEENHLAEYKKKPKSVTLIWRSSTKADSCSSPTSSKPGRPWARRPCSGTATHGIESRRSPASPYLPSASVWDSMLNSTPPISKARKSSSSCDTFCVTCGATSNWSGMEAASIDAISSKSFWPDKRDCTFIVSLRIHPSSILMNSFGQKRNTIYPTAHRRISVNWERRCDAPSTASETPNGSCGHASTIQSSHGDNFACIHCYSKCQYLLRTNGR
jgi:hypothetical protein